MSKAPTRLMMFARISLGLGEGRGMEAAPTTQMDPHLTKDAQAGSTVKDL